MENIFTTFRPFAIFAKYLGLFPRSFEGKVRNGILKVKSSDVFISILIFSLVNTFTLLKALSVDYSHENSLLAMMYVHSLNFEYVTLFIKLLYQNLKNKNYQKILSLIDKFDKKVRV
jgi:hypothetical protein